MFFGKSSLRMRNRRMFGVEMNGEKNNRRINMRERRCLKTRLLMPSMNLTAVTFRRGA